MQTAGELAKRATTERSSEQPRMLPPISRECTQWVMRFLADVYGEKFGPAIRKNGEKQADYDERKRRVLKQWHDVFASSGLTEVELRFGAQRCARELVHGQAITPADVIQRAVMVPEHMGLPTVDQAYRECREQGGRRRADRVFSHLVVEAAFYQLALEDWRELPDRSLRKQWERIYAVMVRRHALNENLRAEIPRALPAPPAPRPRPEDRFPHVKAERGELADRVERIAKSARSFASSHSRVAEPSFPSTPDEGTA